MKNASTTRKGWLILAVLAVLTIAAAALSFRLAPTFQGSRVKEPEEYRLDIRLLNGSDSYGMTLKAADTLRIHFETRSGWMKLEILAPDGNALYSGNSGGTLGTDFDLTIPEDGDYQICVTGKRAAGELLVQPVR